MTASSVTGGDSAKKLNDLGRGRAGDDRLRNHGRPVNDGISVEDAHRKLLNAWFNDTKSGEEYSQVFEKRLRKNDDQQNIIHRAIKRFRREPNDINPLPVIKEIQSLVVEHPDFFVEADEDDKIPMIEAAKHHIATLFRVIDLLISRDSFIEIEKPFTGDCVKCPLLKASILRLRQCSRSVRSDADVISTLVDGEQCLHHTVDVQRLLEKDKQLRKRLELVLKSEKRAESCLESLLNQNNFDSGRKAAGRVLPLLGFKALLQLCPDELFNRKPKDATELTPLQRAVKLYDAQNIDYGLLLSVIQALIDRHPDSIFVKDAKGRNAYRLLKEQQKTRNNSRVEAEDLLKRKCIGFKGSSSTDEDGMWSKKSEFLYWDAETASVTLPYWKPSEDAETAAERTAPEVGQKSSDQSHKGRSQKSREQEANPYPGIFDWLWDKGVRKIFTLDVDDDGPESHTNASIREALTGLDSKDNAVCPRDFRVEVWKWKKFDICAETVAIAAPEARRIHLYSHGNTAVLRGWATSNGLARLEKLEQLSIEIYPSALKWAIDMKVDIISISWTFERKGSANDAYERQFEDLLKTAVENNIVIFGALPDKTGAKTEDFAPLGLNKKVFKIGAATIYGEAARENLDAQVDFLLPGENLPSSTGKLVSGSSYATAYASGLAAIVMFCLKAFEALSDTDGDKYMLEAWTKATAYDCMKGIFKTLSGKSSTYDSDGRLFVRPYQTFGQDFDKPDEHDVYFLRKIVRDMVR
ncbi:hypothetical protein COL154_008338 [Colletotrichum chrysophilum]|nr:hypothetical protein COL154_008338 [Colletotrichum chrysophilum]